MKIDELKKVSLGDLLEAYIVLHNLEAALESMQGDDYPINHREMAAGLADAIREMRDRCHRKKTEVRE